jgi:tight adherence protein B
LDFDLAPLAAMLAGLVAFSFYAATSVAVRRRRAVGRNLEQFLPSAAEEAAAPVAKAATESSTPPRDQERFQRMLQSPGFRTAAGLGFAAIVMFVIFRSPIIAMAAVLELLALMTVYGHSVADGKKRLLVAQTLPTVLRMSAALRAGASLQQAMESVALDGAEPTKDEFRRALNEVSTGVGLDDALDRLASRISTDDYRALAISLAVQRRVGGNLALVLDSVAETARERIRLRQNVDALTAQQRMSTWVLMLLPVVVGCFLLLVDRAFLLPLIQTTSGQILLLVAATLQLIGAFVMRMVQGVDL